MAIFRKVYVKIWMDDKFPFLSDDLKLVFLHLLTTPHSTPFGLFRASINTLADEMRWSVERYSKAFAEGVSKGFWKYDEKNFVVYLNNFLSHNSPANPNVLKSFLKMMDSIPDSELKHIAISDLKDIADQSGEAWVKAFRGAFASLCRTEREREREKELLNPPIFPPPGGSPDGKNYSNQKPEKENNLDNPIQLKGNTKLTQATLEVLELWNQAMGKQRKWSKGLQDKIKKCLQLDSEWLDKARLSARSLSYIDDKDWPGGKVRLEWWLQMYNPRREYDPVVDKILDGAYKLKPIPIKSYREKKEEEEKIKSRAPRNPEVQKAAIRKAIENIGNMDNDASA